MQQAPAQIATVVNSKVAALTLNAFILLFIEVLALYNLITKNKQKRSMCIWSCLEEEGHVIH